MENNKTRIGIVGHGFSGRLAAALAETANKTSKTIVAIAEEDKGIEIKDRPKLDGFIMGNQNGIITCNGRHEYREYKGNWICHCGKKL